ncbi:hypothetical protein MKJ01_04960 [Chryseobacterium sp. SSA4.19]|uniref:hypothetical protein n=1 Tax=Chryseobacterium sp. SSA4.19 TaxID=2919915 RepID=UPI001F4F5581|nr:hypothetical protein [Chryseobacterium sp. SSA4.19]MCJ8153113.1 hypothetical protein [Chryseobacterium sp. SSA4.19]
MKRILMIWMVLSFSFVYSQQQGLDDLDKVFDEYEKEYHQKNNPYAESPNDTERMREMKKRLSAQRQQKLDINKLSQQQKEEANKYKNIENSAIRNSAQSISGFREAPKDLGEAINMSEQTSQKNAYDNTTQTVVVSNANEGIIIANNKDIIKTETETNKISKEMILAFSFVALLFLLVIIRRKRIKN